MNTGDAIRDFFQDQIGKDKRFPTQVEMARFLGLSPTTATKLYKFLEGARTGYAVVIDWLEKLGGQVAMPDDEIDGFVFVHRVAAVAGAGESWEIDDSPEALYAFRESFMRYLRVNPKKAVTMFVRGDSMEPLILDRDMILIDTADTLPQDGLIYVLSFGGALMVKKMQRTLNGWNICSENTKYPPVPVEGQEADALRIFGRVRWFGRVL